MYTEQSFLNKLTFDNYTCALTTFHKKKLIGWICIVLSGITYKHVTNTKQI